MADADASDASGGGVDDDGRTLPAVPRPRRMDWWSMLWLWPAMPIALVALASMVFGSDAALLVAGETVGVLLFIGAIRLFGDRHWVGAGLAVIAASLVALAGLYQLHVARRPSGAVSAATAGQQAANYQPVDFQGEAIGPKEASRANFVGANLKDANLSGLNLAGKNFDGAVAVGASLQGANLNATSFRGADLRGACLRGAILVGADLSGADLTGADVSGVTISAKTKATAARWPPLRRSFNVACS